jgi:ribosome-associated protein
LIFSTKNAHLAKKRSGNVSLKKVVIDAILDKKGNDVVSLDLRKIKDTPSEYFIIAHGDSVTHVRAISQHVLDETSKLGFKPYHTEGSKNSEWIIVDFVDITVHIFHRDKRDFYDLEELWNDAKLTKYVEGS